MPDLGRQAFQEIPVVAIILDDPFDTVSTQIQSGEKSLGMGGKQIAPLGLQAAVVRPNTGMALMTERVYRACTAEGCIEIQVRKALDQGLNVG